MILVDSSVWIDYFHGKRGVETDLLDRLMDSGRLLVGDLILAEVLQGFRSESAAERALSHFEPFEFRAMGGHAIAIRAARHYRFLRQKGVTLRSTIDTLIATSASPRVMNFFIAIATSIPSNVILVFG